jgi:hypothetical protein
MSEARDIINGVPKGFMVAFYHKDGGILRGDHFPDKHGGEPLIPTEEEAWELARLFAERTVGKCVEIYVTDHAFVPVPGYEARKIVNRKPAPQSSTP